MRGGPLAGLLASLLLASCLSAPPAPESYVVQPGDTLYSIAWRHDLDYRTLARWNGVAADFRLHVGQVLRLAAPRGAAAADGGRLAAVAPAPQDRAAPPFDWTWPTDASGPPVPGPSGGILMRGEAGQDVRAAAAGRVVYTGNGIRGYGNLIIIKHPAGWLSAYAHNREMLVHEGEEVAPGQRIARMGEPGGEVPELYFEIRRDGRPVDPMLYLPRR